MATAHKIYIDPEDTGLWTVKQTAESAKKASELLQQDLAVRQLPALMNRTNTIGMASADVQMHTPRDTTFFSTTWAFTTTLFTTFFPSSAPAPLPKPCRLHTMLTPPTNGPSIL